MLTAKRICIVRLGGLGDVINTLPALDALRAACPDAHIAWLVETAWKDVLPGPPRLDEVIELPKREWLDQLRGISKWPSVSGDVGRFVGELRKHKFDLAIDFHGNLRSGIATRITGAPNRAGFAPDFCKEFNYLFTNRHFPVGKGAVHRIDRALALAEAIGAKPTTDTPKMDVPEDALAFAREVFETHDLTTRPVVAIHPATSQFGAYKRWPVERYNAIIRRLDEHGTGALVTWGPGEYEMAVAAAGGTNAQVSPETKSIPQLAGLLSLCDAFVGADTGPGILAAAVDTPTVSIFGPKDAAVYAPRHARARVVEIPMDCRPCKKRECDDPKCVLNITVDHVADAVFALLDEMEGN
jgi:lipopolysaccharide heptosyltransferase I